MRRNIEIYKITATAFLMALAIVLSRVPFLSTYISIGGVNIVKIGFQEIPLMLVCLICGPLYSMIASFGADLLAATIMPTGPYFPGFTFDALLLGLIPALLLKFYKNDKIKFSIIYLIMIIITSLTFTLQCINLNQIKVGDFRFELKLWMKIVIPISVIFVLILNYVLLLLFDKKNKHFFKYYEVYSIYFIRDLVIAPLIAPIWIMFLYNVPYQVSYISQFLSKMITLPILSIMTIFLITPLSKVLKHLLNDTYKNIDEKIYIKVSGGKRLI